LTATAELLPNPCCGCPGSDSGGAVVQLIAVCRVVDREALPRLKILPFKQASQDFFDGGRVGVFHRIDKHLLLLAGSASSVIIWAI
jgi:hypothetical protein